MTPQRLAILHVLHHEGRHLSPVEVHEEARRELPSLTETTVYRTLEFLAENGLARPALAAVAIFSFLGAWDEFTWALTAINDEKLYTLPIALRLFQQQHGTEWGLVFAASAIAVLPTILVFVIFQRHFIKGVMSGAVKG